MVNINHQLAMPALAPDPQMSERIRGWNTSPKNKNVGVPSLEVNNAKPATSFSASDLTERVQEWNKLPTPGGRPMDKEEIRELIKEESKGQVVTEAA